jgi:hypothetical protein
VGAAHTRSSERNAVCPQRPELSTDLAERLGRPQRTNHRGHHDTAQAGNYYTGNLYSGVDEEGRIEDAGGDPVQRVVRRGLPTTAGWEIFPEGRTDLLVRISRDYPTYPS